jgi:hypothetical protein
MHDFVIGCIMWQEEVLVDKTIVGVKVKSPSVWLQVQEGGWIEINVEGDCCSEAFVDAVRLHGTPKLTGKSEEISFPAQVTTQEVDEVTAVRFDGEHGSVSILHRNSSNGYYGNYLSVNLRGEPPADAVDGKEWYRDVQVASR